MAGIELLTYDDFAGRVGERFEVLLTDEDALTLELIEVTQGAELPEQRRQFAVVFRGPAEPVLAQSIHALSHDAMGELELFLVPIGRDTGGASYEAVFA